MVVLTSDRAIAYLSTVTVAAATSTVRGVPSPLVLHEDDSMKWSCAVDLHNATTISQGGLAKRVAHLSSLQTSEICAVLRFSRDGDVRRS